MISVAFKLAITAAVICAQIWFISNVINQYERPKLSAWLGFSFIFAEAIGIAAFLAGVWTC